MSYTGLEIPLPLGQLGLIGPEILATTPFVPLIDATNIAYEVDSLTRALGSARYNASAIAGAPALRALLDWHPTPSLQRLLVVGTDGKVYRDDGAGTFGTVMKTGLSVSIPVWAEGGGELLGNPKKAFLTTGADPVQVVEGDASTTRNIGANAPSDWSGGNQPRTLLAHAQRLWGALNDRWYFSKPDDHEDFNDTANGAGNLSIGPGIGQRIEAGMPIKDLLFTFKWPRGIFVVNTTDPTVANWTIEEMSRTLGIAGPRALDLVDNDIVFLSEVGHIHLASNVRNNDILASDLTAASSLTQWTKDHLNLDPAVLARSVGKYHPERKEMHFAVPGVGSTVLNLCLVINFQRTGTPRISVRDMHPMESLALRIDSAHVDRLIGGDTTGTVWTMDEPTRTVGGAAYASQFQTPHDDFAWYNPGLRTRRKNLSFLEIIGTPTGDFTLSVDVYLDGVYSETLSYSLGGTGAELGSFVLGTGVLGGSGTLAARKRLHGSARRVSFVVKMAGADENFRIAALVLGCTPDGHRPV